MSFAEFQRTRHFTQNLGQILHDAMFWSCPGTRPHFFRREGVGIGCNPACGIRADLWSNYPVRAGRATASQSPTDKHPQEVRQLESLIRLKRGREGRRPGASSALAAGKPALASCLPIFAMLDLKR